MSERVTDGTSQPADEASLAGVTTTPGPEPVAAEVEAGAGTVNGTRFAHASEAEMARILDFYDVRWQYEPTTFPILWNLDGEVVESFAPDFYLPELDMFLEMTTLKQRLVRKKNRKLRRLRELYPDIRIKLFYARDFRAMMLKYGRLALAESLSGTTGQVVPERAVAATELPIGEVEAELPTGDAAGDLPAAAAETQRSISIEPPASGELPPPIEPPVSVEPPVAVEAPVAVEPPASIQPGPSIEPPASAPVALARGRRHRPGVRARRRRAAAIATRADREGTA